MDVHSMQPVRVDLYTVQRVTVSQHDGVNHRGYALNMDAGSDDAPIPRPLDGGW